MMPTLDNHAAQTTAKVLLLGNSGSGKTGSLAALAAAGYRLFVADFDNGLDILLDPKVLKPEFRKNVNYKLFVDKPKLVGNALVPMATAWNEFTKAIGDWKEGTTSLGNITTWGPKDVLVVDSFTFACDRCMDAMLMLNGRLGQKAQIQDYGAAVDALQSFLELIAGVAQCNVVITAHLQFQGDEMSGQRKAFPNVLGQKLAPKAPRYFNNMILVEKQTLGNTTNILFKTVGTPFIDLKVSKPGKVPASMPANLAKLFEMLLGNEGSAAGR
jgi:hypothetical protein